MVDDYDPQLFSGYEEEDAYFIHYSSSVNSRDHAFTFFVSGVSGTNTE